MASLPHLPRTCHTVQELGDKIDAGVAKEQRYAEGTRVTPAYGPISLRLSAARRSLRLDFASEAKAGLKTRLYLEMERLERFDAGRAGCDDTTTPIAFSRRRYALLADPDVTALLERRAVSRGPGPT
jgi:hypothetical protein